MTNHWNDIDNASAVLVMGANPAENHPACFGHINMARFGAKKAKLYVVDPRKTRTALQADNYIRIRPGTDIAFFNAVVSWIIDNIATEYPAAWANMQAFHNGTSANLVAPGRTFVCDGDAAPTTFAAADWAAAYYDDETGRHPFAGGGGGWPKYTDSRIVVEPAKKDYKRGTLHISAAGVAKTISNLPYFADTFDAAGTVFSTLKEHVDWYKDGSGTLSVAADICGCYVADFETIARLAIENSRFSSSDFGTLVATPNAVDYKALTWLYAMGQTQHTYGSQNVRAGAVLQTLMGNMGRAGGGVNALRGIHNVQGSTDFGLLYDAIPGYSGNPGQDDTFAGYMNNLFGARVAGGGANWKTSPYGSSGLQQVGFKVMTRKFFGPNVPQDTLTPDPLTAAVSDVLTMGATIDSVVYNGFASLQIAARTADASADAYLVTVAGFKPTKAEVDADPTLLANPTSWDTLVFRTSNPGVFSTYTFVGRSDAQTVFRANVTEEPESGAFVNDAETYYAFINAVDGKLYKLSSTDGISWTWVGQVNDVTGDPLLTEPRVIRDGLGGFWIWGIEKDALGNRTGKIVYSHLEKEANGTFEFVDAAGTPHAYNVVQIDGADSAADSNPFVVYSSGTYQLYWTRGQDVWMAQGTKKTAFYQATKIHDHTVGSGGYENGVIAGGTSIVYTKFDPAKTHFPFNDVKSIQKPWVNKVDALFSLWPKNNGYDHIKAFRKMKDHTVKAFYVLGQNPAVSEPNQAAVRDGLFELDLLVVQDMFETETAAAKRKDTGVTYLLPACSHVEEAGSVTNSGRWLMWRDRATAPKGNSRTDLELILRLSKAIDTAGGFNHISTLWGQISYTPTASRWEELFGYYANNGTTAWDGTSTFEAITGSRPSGPTQTGVADFTGSEFVADKVYEEICKPASGATDSGAMWIYANGYNTNRTSLNPAAPGGVSAEKVTLAGTTAVNLAFGGINLATKGAPVLRDGTGAVVAASQYVINAGSAAPGVAVVPGTIAKSGTATIPDGDYFLEYWYTVPWAEANRAKSRDISTTGLAQSFGRYGWAWLANRRVFYNNTEVPCDQDDNFVAPGFLARLYVIATNTFADFAGNGAYRYYSTLADKASVNTSAGQRQYHAGRFPGHAEPAETPRDGAGTQSDLVTVWGRNLWVDGNGKAHPTYPTGIDGQTVDAGTKLGSSDKFPFVLTTIRCVEHFQGGPITRNNPWNHEVEPEPWIEINSYDARKYGIVTGDWVNIITARSNSTSDQRARTVMTGPLAADTQTDPLLKGISAADNTWTRGFRARVGTGLSSNQRVGPGVVAIPWHWGDRGLSLGARANDLCVDAFDANTRISESKACLCFIQKRTTTAADYTPSDTWTVL